ncbi:MAG: hypothetical protein RMH97_01180 [Verrucomicrobiales bacterium]|nr:hypothetical protein [Verrucomicrobiales bacterium]
MPGLLTAARASAARVAVLEFQALRDETVAIEASDDLKSWTTLYQLRPNATQTLQIADPESAYLPKRFYRLAGPLVVGRKLALRQFSAPVVPKLSFAAAPGAVVEIQVSNDRKHWTTLQIFELTSHRPLEFLDATPSEIPMRFYRTAVNGMTAAEVIYFGPDALRCTMLAHKEITVLRFWATAGEAITLQASEDLINWTPLFEVHAETNKWIELADPASETSMQRFYRLSGTNIAHRKIELARFRAPAIAKVSFVAPPGDLVQLQASENLTNWRTLYRLKVHTNWWIEIVDLESAWLPQRFYRLAPGS